MKQIIDGQTKQVQEVINENLSETGLKSDTTSSLDGMFSGSTFIYIAVVFAVVSIIGIIAKIISGRHESQSD